MNAHAEEIRIIVNARPEIVPSREVSYEEVVKLAYPTPPEGDITYTVTFRNAENERQGSLVAGGSVEVKKEGTIFNVKATTRS